MKTQSPPLRWFVLTVQKGSKKETKRLLATDKTDAIRRGNKILKYVPGSGPDAKVTDAREAKEES